MDDWRERIRACGEAVLAEALIASIEDLFANDVHLLDVNVHENAVASRLIGYLAPRAPIAPDGARWHVDCDYNRQGVQVKKINGAQQVRPDVIVHRRNTDALNHLAIEIKKGSSSEADEDDIGHLQAYRWPIEGGGLGYVHALFLRFGVQEDAGRVTCVVWV